MATKKGSWGANATDTWFNDPVSLGLTMGAQEYPNGSISVNISSSASPTKAWQTRDGGTNRALDFYLCDSSGGNTISLWTVTGFQPSGRFIYSPNSTTISNTSKKLMGKALYVKGVGVHSGDVTNVGTYGAITMTISTSISTYKVTLKSDPAAGGTTTGSGTFQYNTKHKLTATASTGYTFSSWTKTSGTLSSTSNTATTFTVPAAASTVTANFTHNTYSITKKANPAAGGSVSGASVAYYNDAKKMTATANTGYEFSSWSKSGGSFSDASINPTTFTMPNSNATVTANFTHIQYTLTGKSSPTAGGSVSGGGTKYYDDKVKMTATASTGYTFASWSASGGTLSSTTSNPTTFTMPNSNATVTAAFTHNTYSFYGMADPLAGGSVAVGDSVLYYNDTTTVIATANTGYTFNHWLASSGTLANESAASTTFTMPAADAAVTAYFTHNTYTVTNASNPSAGGSVTLGASSGYYDDKIQISAAANTGYTFANWSVSGGSVSNSTASPSTFTLPAVNSTVTANFTHNTYTINKVVNPTAGGSVVLSAESGHYNDKVQAIATASTGYTFSTWTVSSGSLSSSTASPTTFTLPAANSTITAGFTHNVYTVSKVSNPTVGGSVTLSAASGFYNDKIQISATANTGYTFNGWTTTGGTLDSSSASPTTFTLPAAHSTITAGFTHNTYTVTVVEDPLNTGSVSTSTGSGFYNDTVTLTATPAAGYKFVRWQTSGGTLSSTTTNPATLTLPASNVTVTGIFAMDKVSLKSSVNPSGTGSMTTLSGEYSVGSSINLVATPASGYQFSEWSSTSGNDLFKDYMAATTTFTVPMTATTVTAHFRATSSTYEHSGRYNGLSYDPLATFYYDGTAWVPIELQRYNGSSWDEVTVY